MIKLHQNFALRSADDLALRADLALPGPETDSVALALAAGIELLRAPIREHQPLRYQYARRSGRRS